MCNKAVDTYPPVIQFVPDQYKTQKVCVKAFDIVLFAFYFVPHWYKAQEVCNKFVSKDPIMLNNR